MNINKYIIFGILGLLITVSGAYYAFHNFYLYEANLISAIPKDFGQVFYLNVDDNIKDFLDKSGENNRLQDIKGIVKDIKEVVVYEGKPSSSIKPLIMARVTSSFDPDKAKDIGLFKAKKDYKVRRVKGDIFAYGNKKGLNFISNYDGEDITDIDYLSGYINDLKKGNKNVGFFSTADMSRLDPNTNKFVRKYLNKIKYTAVTSNIKGNGVNGSVDIIFNDELNYGSNKYSFQNVLYNYYTKNSLMYLEIGNLIDFLDINVEKFVQKILLFVQQAVPDKSRILSNINYERILNSFNGNIAIILQKGNNNLGLGAKVIFENTKMFNILKDFWPIIDKLVKSQKGKLKGNLSTYSGNNNYGLDFKYNVGDLYNIDSSINIEKKNGNTIISILEPFGGGDNREVIDFLNKSLIAYNIDLGNMLQYYKSNPIFSIFRGSGDRLSYFKGKQVIGEMFIDGNIISFTFKLK